MKMAKYLLCKDKCGINRTLIGAISCSDIPEKNHGSTACKKMRMMRIWNEQPEEMKEVGIIIMSKRCLGKCMDWKGTDFVPIQDCPTSPHS